MKKILIGILVALTVLCMVAGLCSCDKGDGHTHSYSIESKKAEYVKSEASCTSGTVIYYSCLCGEKGSETFELDNKMHNTTKAYTDTNTLYHTTKVTCRDCSAVVSETLEFHTYSDDKNCAYCDHRKKSSEFKAGLYQTGTETLLYSWDELISEGILSENGKATESGKEKLVGDLVVDKSVYSIEENSIDGDVKNTILNLTVTELAYNDCDGIVRVCLPGFDENSEYIKEYVKKRNETITKEKYKINVTGVRISVGDHIFAECDALVSVTFPSTLYSVGNYAFYNCDALTSIELPNRVTTLGAFAFANCTNMETVVLGESITTLGKNCLWGLHNLANICLPASVEQIDAYALSGCYELFSIEYKGTTEAWNNIKKNTYWAGYPNEYRIICSDGEVME